MRSEKILLRLFIMLFLLCLPAMTMAATSVTQSFGASQGESGGIPTLPGKEISPQDMQKHFPAPLRGSAPSIPFAPDAAPLIPALPLHEGGKNPKALHGTGDAEQKTQAQDFPAYPSPVHLSPSTSLPSAPPTKEPLAIPQPLVYGKKTPEQKALEESLRRALNPSTPHANMDAASAQDALGQAVLPVDPKPTGFPPLETMLGQMLLAGFTGTEVERLSPIATLIKENKVGGVFLEAVPEKKASNTHEQELLALAQSGLSAQHSAAALAQVGLPGNVESAGQVRRLIATLQSFVPAKAPALWVAVEQEGGMAQTLRPDLGFAGLVSAARLGQGSVENTEIAARRAGLEMAGVGINFALGPAGDVNVNPLSEHIGKRFRSFGSNAAQVAAHVMAFGRGLVAAKVLPCIRNYPGTGSYVRGFAPTQGTLSAQKNILESIPDISGTWQQRELVPYKESIMQNLGEQQGQSATPGALRAAYALAVQPALVYHRTYDSLHPVPLSSTMLGGMLRQQWGFQGMIVSQDLRALQPFFSLEESVLQSVLAGVDVLLITEPPATVDPASSPLAGLGVLSSLPGMGNVEALAGLMNSAKKSEADSTEEALLQMLLQNQGSKLLPGVFGAEVKAKPHTGLATQAEKVFAVLLQLVQSGRISEARIRQSWIRITQAKKNMGLMPLELKTP